MLKNGVGHNPVVPVSFTQVTTLKRVQVSLRSYPRNVLPKTLKSLTFLSCENLEFLPYFTSLEKLQIFNICDSLTSSQLVLSPLSKFFSSGCKNLKSFSFSEEASHSHLFLQSLSIYACPNLQSFPLHRLNAHLFTVYLAFIN